MLRMILKIENETENERVMPVDSSETIKLSERRDERC
jgi:hypothetical protein